MVTPIYARRYIEAPRAAAGDYSPLVDHCYGIVLHHRARWWLVEFPELDVKPVAVYRLSGKMTPAMVDRLRRTAGDPGLTDDIAVLNPETSVWAGEFTRCPARHGDGEFDIAANPWNSAADELETRLARTMIDSLIRPLPPGFTSVLDALPDDDKPVLAVRLSGYICATFELLTARHMPTYRPRSPWRDISGDAVSDSGSDILGWMPAHEWLLPA